MSKLNKIIDNSIIKEINEEDKIVIMSDVHRGNGNNYDTFLKNRNIYDAALLYYDKLKFTYIELGDGDDLWKVKNHKEIIDTHINTFKILKKLHDDNRLIMIYGNHDYEKKNEEFVKDFYNNILKNLKVHESIILKYYNNNILLIHGHQADFKNSKAIKISKFLVRYIWKHLENLFMNDPTSSATNYEKLKHIDKKLTYWSKNDNVSLIAGHTHKAVFSDGNYYNDGCVVSPNGITAIEIENGSISLVRWQESVREDSSIYVDKTILKKKILPKNI